MTSYHRQICMTFFFSFSLFNGLSFIFISSLALEFWEFLFLRDLTRNLEIENTPSEYCTPSVFCTPSEIYRISGCRKELGILNLAWAILMKSYLILQNASFIIFIASEFLRKPNRMNGTNPPILIRITWRHLQTGHFKINFISLDYRMTYIICYKHIL